MIQTRGSQSCADPISDWQTLAHSIPRPSQHAEIKLLLRMSHLNRSLIDP